MEPFSDRRVMGAGAGALAVIIACVIGWGVSASRGGTAAAERDALRAEKVKLEASLAEARNGAASADALTAKAREERDQQSTTRRKLEAELEEARKGIKTAETARTEAETAREKATREAEKAEAERKRMTADRDHQRELLVRANTEVEDLRKQVVQLRAEKAAPPGTR